MVQYTAIFTMADQ